LALAHPQRAQRALAQGGHGGVGAHARALELDVELLHHAARPAREHRDAVGEQDCLLDVVGDEHDGPRLAGEGRGEPFLHLRSRDRVERAERLVEAQQRLARQQRAHERHALAHAAGELVRTGVLEALQAQLGEQRGRAGA
jgi:hypothetical protein